MMMEGFWGTTTGLFSIEVKSDSLYDALYRDDTVEDWSYVVLGRAYVSLDTRFSRTARSAAYNEAVSNGIVYC